MSVPPLDLLIVGAGPVGLATAVGAVHRGAKRVLVVEQARELRPIGRNLDFLPNAVRALSALAPGLRESFEPFLRVPQPGKVRAFYVSTSGCPISSQESADYGTTGSILWWQLQRLLLDALPDPQMLVLNHQLVDIVHEDGTGLARAEFVANRQRKNIYKNWEDDDLDSFPAGMAVGDQNSSQFEVCEGKEEDAAQYGVNVKRVMCRAKIIVGADGINSAARRCVYRDSGGWEAYAGAVYSGFVRIAAAGNPHIAMDDKKFLEDHFLRNSEMCHVTCREDSISPDSLRLMIVHPQKESKAPFSWYMGYYLALDERTVKHSTPAELTQIASDTALREGLPEKLVQISRQIWDSPGGSRVPILPYYVVPATHPPPFVKLKTGGSIEYPPGFKRPWHYRRVVLVGDAVHAAPPFLAQGAAMGLEDAFDLVTRLASMGIWSEQDGGFPNEKDLDVVFECYHLARLDRVCFVQNRIMNRTSEYDSDAMEEIRNTVYAYDPLSENYTSTGKS